MFGSVCFRCSTLVEDTPLLSCPTKKLQRCSVNKAAAVLQSALTGCRAAAAAAATAAGLIMLVSACHVSSRVSRCCHALVTSPVCWLPRPSVRCVLTPGRWCRGWSAAPAAVSPWELHQLSFPRVPGAEARQPRHLSAALHTTAASKLC